MIDELVPWLRKRITMASQSAHALRAARAAGGLQSLWSPDHLHDHCTAHAALVDHLLSLPASPQVEYGIRLVATAYRRCAGFKPEWDPIIEYCETCRREHDGGRGEHCRHVPDDRKWLPGNEKNTTP